MFRSLQSVIRSLDVRRAQVLIEALIAEVSDETAREIGIQWQATDGLSHEGVVGGTNFPTAGNGGIVGAITNPLGALGAGIEEGFPERGVGSRLRGDDRRELVADVVGQGGEGVAGADVEREQPHEQADLLHGALDERLTLGPGHRRAQEAVDVHEPFGRAGGAQQDADLLQVAQLTLGHLKALGVLVDGGGGRRDRQNGSVRGLPSRGR